MAAASHMFLVFAFLLALGITGPYIFTDARQAEWDVPLEPSAQIPTPLNLSGDFQWDVPFEPSGHVPTPLNLSGDSEWDLPFQPSGQISTPLNFSGNSVGELFEATNGPFPHVASTFNLSEDYVEKHFEVTADKSFSKVRGGQGVPGFVIINNMAQDVVVQCYNDAIPPPVKMLVNAGIAPHEQVGWDLNTIDPNSLHEAYGCMWLSTAPSGAQQVISQDAWVSLGFVNKRIPFYCVRCTWKVSDDGLYLFEPFGFYYTKVKNWGTSS